MIRLGWLITAVCSLWMGLSTVATCNDLPPNVIVILADDLGWSDTSLNGQTKFHQTPNLDRLAQRGVTFTSAYSASPLCSPTRSALLTGMSPARTGITTPNCHLPQVVLNASLPTTAPPNQKSIQPTPVTRLKTEYQTLAETLKQAGYATGHFGKWHLGAEPFSPLQQGFDVDLPHHSGPGPAGSYVAPWRFSNFAPRVPEEHIEDRMVDEAIQWIEKQNGKPFYLNYWMFSVHAPFDAKAELIRKHTARLDQSDEQKCPTYAAMLESMDDAIGRLLNALDRLQISDNTIIIFTSDNGGNMYNEVAGVVPTSNRPLRGGKATLFEGGTRVPCVVVWPGITAPNTKNDSLIQSEDFYPTLLQGLKLDSTNTQPMDGSSMLEALQGTTIRNRYLFQYFPHSPAVPEWLPPAISVHYQDWKLIRIFHGGENGAHRFLLFDLAKDISETHNIAADFPDVVHELDAKVEEFLAKTGAVVPVANPRFDPTKYDPSLEGKAQPKVTKSPRESASLNNNKPNATGLKENDPVLKGWKVRNSQATCANGILKLTDLKENSFLGFAAGKHRGVSHVRFRIKAKAGEAHVDWLPDGVGGNPQSVTYSLTENAWQDVAVELPADTTLGIVRIYFPTESESVEIDSIKITSENPSQVSSADF